MPRQRKEYSPISLKMDKTVFERLQSYSKESGVPKTTIIERAIARYLDEKAEGEVSNQR